LASWRWDPIRHETCQWATRENDEDKKKNTSGTANRPRKNQKVGSLGSATEKQKRVVWKKKKGGWWKCSLEKKGIKCKSYGGGKIKEKKK